MKADKNNKNEQIIISDKDYTKKGVLKRLSLFGLAGVMCMGLAACSTQGTPDAVGSSAATTEAVASGNAVSVSKYVDYITKELSKEYEKYIDESAKNYKGAGLLADEYRETLLALQPLVDAAYAGSNDHLAVFETVCNGNPVDPKDIEGMETITCDAPNAKGKMDMYIFRPKDAKEDEVLPCVYLAHGGGYYAGTPLSEKNECELLANTNHVAVINYDYTLTKEAPYPAALNDAYAGLKYIYENADELKIDKNKIILHGESGGGGLAACLALYTKDQKEIPLLGEVLVYPMLDYRTGSDADTYKNPYTGEFLVTKEDLKLCWEKMFAGQTIPDDRMIYASPSVATVDQVKGLPATYIIVGSLDAFVNEDVDYANKLTQAGVPTELFVENGVPHAYDLVANDTEQKARFNDLRREFIDKLLNK